MLVAPQYEMFSYHRRVPEQELLHRILVEHLETFLDRARTEDHKLPSYVEKELRNYVACGVLGCGFVRLKCDCGKEEERVVALTANDDRTCSSTRLKNYSEL
jgi:hypothetical protein